MAAKAAGLVVVGEDDKMVAQPGRRHEGGLVVKNEFGGDSLWHPGEDDGIKIDRLLSALRKLVNEPQDITSKSYQHALGVLGEFEG